MIPLLKALLITAILLYSLEGHVSSHLNEIKKGNGFLLRTTAVIGRAQGADKMYEVTKRQMNVILEGIERELLPKIKWYKDSSNLRSPSASWVDWSQIPRDSLLEANAIRLPLEFFPKLKEREKESSHPVYLAFSIKTTSKFPSDQIRIAERICLADFIFSIVAENNPSKIAIKEEKSPERDLEDQNQIDLIRELDLTDPDTALKILKRESVLREWVEGKKPWPQSERPTEYLHTWGSIWLQAIRGDSINYQSLDLTKFGNEDLEKAIEGTLILTVPSERLNTLNYFLTKFQNKLENKNLIQKLQIWKELILAFSKK